MKKLDEFSGDEAKASIKFNLRLIEDKDLYKKICKDIKIYKSKDYLGLIAKV